MRVTRPAALALLAAAAGFAPLAAQEHRHDPTPPSAIGRVRFATSCSAAAQPGFERAVALLHSFWYDEARAAFQAAAAADTTCAMAYWGIASSYLTPLWAPPTAEVRRAGAAAAERARALNAPTQRERGYIAAISAFYENHDAAPHGARLRAWEQVLGRVHADNPDDTEAAIFHALALVATASKTDTTYAQLRQAGALLEPLFMRMPEHPGVAHYLIHSYDAPALVADARRAADRYAGIAPSVPHAQHMPSHSYTLLGMWDQSIAANLRSADAARRFEREQNMPGAWDQRLHALDYTVYAYLQVGRDSLARAVAAEAAAVTAVVPAGSVTADYALAAIPARLVLERSDWRAAAAIAPYPSGAPHARAVRRFTRAIGAARSGDAAAARVELAALDSLETAARATPDPFSPLMVRVNRLAAGAWVLLAEGDTAGALRMAAEAADAEDNGLKNPLTPGPLLSARELQGDILMLTGRSADAVVAYRAALVATPKRARTLRNAVTAANAARDTAAARRWQGELRQLLARADREQRIAGR